METIKDFFRETPILSSIISLLLFGLIFILIDGISINKEPFSGIVVDKHYKAERNSTGTGYGMTSSGKTGVIVTSEHESEKFLVMVKTKSGKIFTVECEPSLYYSKKNGDEIFCHHQIGLFAKSIWSSYGDF